MKSLHTPAQVFIVALAIAAGTLLVTLIEFPDIETLPEFLALVALSVVTSALKLPLPTIKNRTTMSASFVVDFTAMLVFGAHATMLVAAAGGVSQSLFGGIRRNPPHRTIFNAACFIVTIEATGFAFRLFGGSTGHFVWPDAVAPLVAAAMTYFLVNSGLIALVVSLSSRQPVTRVWQQNFLWSGPNYFIGALAGAAFATVIADELWAFLPLAAVPVYLTHRAYRVYAGRLADEHRHRQVIESLNEGMAVIDARGVVTLWNDSLERITRQDRSTVLNRPLAAVLSIRDDSELSTVIAAALRDGTSQALDQFVIRHREGERILQVRVIPFVGGATLFFDDITDWSTAQAQLREAALHDTLTGLPNRRLFTEHLRETLEHGNGRSRHICGVLFLDVDRFKVVNDSLGHEAGDQLLVALSERLRACLRPSDVLARLGGDEFTVLLRELESTSQAAEVAERIQQAVRVPLVVAGREICATASIGIAIGDCGGTDPDEIMRNADTAMYRAKQSGKARHELFDAEMRAEALDRLGFEIDLRRSVERGELTLHYQPIVSLDDGAWTGFEALLRWNRGGDLVPPTTFIPVAEETGIIESLGSWVLNEACRQFGEWSRKYPQRLPRSLTVNVSAKQLMQPEFSRIVERALSDAQMPRSALRLEVTETSLINRPEIIATVLGELRDLGVSIYLDDFGTGFSSLSHLHRLPVDALKIDQSFVNTLMRDDRPAIVESILALAKTLNTTVIAEGVETYGQLGELKRLGCGMAQGFLFSPPLCAADAEAWLRKPPESTRVKPQPATAAVSRKAAVNVALVS